MDRLRALEAFVSVAEEESFSAAARRLGMSPPSITRLVGDLEHHLGASLFNRTTRIVSLTETGAAYLADARRILADLQAADDAARGAFSAPTGLLRVTAPTMFGTMYVSPIIRDYLDRFEDTTVEALFLERIVNLVEEGVDVALRIGELPDSSLIAAKVGEVADTICATPSYFARHGVPRTPEDLARHRLVAVGPLPGFVEWRLGDRKPVRLRPRLICSSVQASIEAARAGWGLTRALSYQVAPLIGSGEMQAALTAYPGRRLPIHVVHTYGRRPPAKLRAFVDMAVDRLRADPFLNGP